MGGIGRGRSSGRLPGKHDGDFGNLGNRDVDVCLHHCEIHQDTFTALSRLSHIFNTLSQ